VKYVKCKSTFFGLNAEIFNGETGRIFNNHFPSEVETNDINKT
jgi:hypothetical protein